MLADRKQKIDHSLKSAEKIEQSLIQTEAERTKILEKATEEAKEIIDEATKSGSQIIDEARQKATQDIKVLIAKSETVMKQEREKMHQEIKAEIANLISSGLKAVTGKILTERDKKDLIAKSIKNIS